MSEASPVSPLLRLASTHCVCATSLEFQINFAFAPSSSTLCRENNGKVILPAKRGLMYMQRAVLPGRGLQNTLSGGKVWRSHLLYIYEKKLFRREIFIAQS